MKVGLKEFTKEDLIRHLTNKIYKEANLFNTKFNSDQAIRLELISLAECIETGEWLKELQEELSNG